MCAFAPLTGGAAMTEEPTIIEVNIAHYEALLNLDLGERQRLVVRRLLAEAKGNLATAVELRTQR
jgi:hypothetical protein